MIQAEDFVEVARARGYTWYAGVPCSFLTPFINCVINDDRLRYVSSANEGDAVATAAGAAIGGKRACAMMQNSGLGNAVSPLTSLTYVFRIPILVICTQRGAPGVPDEPQHELMGQITGAMLDTMHLPWETFPQEASAIAPTFDRAQEYMRREQRPYGLIMQKGTVAAHPLKKTPGRREGLGELRRHGLDVPAARPPRHEALARIIELTPESTSVVIATTGYTGRELYALKDRVNQLYMVGSMGCASSLGLGLALARPDLTVVIVDGDGAALMRMGNLAVIGAYGGNNLYHIVLDNEAYESTGAQRTITAGVEFAPVAHACGYGLAIAGDRLGVIDELFTDPAARGPRLAHVKIRTGTLGSLPRPEVKPPEALRRLMAHIGTNFPGER